MSGWRDEPLQQPGLLIAFLRDSQETIDRIRSAIGVGELRLDGANRSLADALEISGCKRIRVDVSAEAKRDLILVMKENSTAGRAAQDRNAS